MQFGGGDQSTSITASDQRCILMSWAWIITKSEQNNRRISAELRLLTSLLWKSIFGLCFTAFCARLTHTLSKKNLHTVFSNSLQTNSGENIYTIVWAGAFWLITATRRMRSAQVTPPPVGHSLSPEVASAVLRERRPPSHTPSMSNNNTPSSHFVTPITSFPNAQAHPWCFCETEEIYK